MRAVLGVIVLAFVSLPAVSLAQPAAPSYVLAAWNEKTGLPAGEILSMTQDLDGYLWLGTTVGLIRFDGATFTVWDSAADDRLLGRSIPALAGARDGSLWMGFADGGISRLVAGEAIHFTSQHGLPAGPVAAVIEDRAGRIWAAGEGGLSSFREGRWEPVYTDGEVFSLFEDGSGTIWFGTAEGVLSLGQGAPELRHPDRRYVQSFAEDSTGTLWVTDVQSVVRRLDSGAGPAGTENVRLPQSGWRLQRDREGQIWVAALGGGLLTLDQTEPAVIRRVGYEHVTGGAPRSLFYDRERNLWVGLRPGGLLRVSRTSIVSGVPLDGLTHDGVRAMTASADGSVWIGTGHSVNRFHGSTRTVYDVAQTRVLHADPHDRLWVLTSQGLGRLETGEFVPMALPDAIRWDRVTSFAVDGEDTLWLCSSNQGIMSWREDVLQSYAHVERASERNCSYVYVDRQDRVWVGFGTGDIAVWADGSFQFLGADDERAGDAVLAIHEDRAGAIWLTTRSGIRRYLNGRVTQLSSRNGPFTNLVASLVEDLQGFLWVGVDAGAGVVRFDPSTVESVAADPTRGIEYRLFDGSDGMQGELRPLIRTAGVRAADGRLWFATGDGVVIIDPQNLPAGGRPMPPQIEAVWVDGRSIQPVSSLELPNSVSTLSIGYTAVSLGAASKLRFRHRLEGHQQHWVPADGARSATYHGLPPGPYRFRVSVTNDGLWTDAAAWEFVIAPPFYQARWFLIVSVVGIVMLLGTGWWLRLNALRRQYALVFEERARLSREIHDTLLQGLAAMGVELETLAGQLDGPPEPVRDSLRRLRRQVGHSVREARDSIHGLRHNTINTRGLVDALRELAENTTASRPARVELTVTGRPTRCSAEVELQLLRIAQEAVANAIRHGRATHVQIVLEFQPATVALTVTDNGCGFEVEQQGPAADHGEHLGLLAMGERAERICAEFVITSTPGKGTIVQVTAPSEPQ